MLRHLDLGLLPSGRVARDASHLIPSPNKYTEVVEWLQREKNNRDYYRETNNNTALLARKLSEIFGWAVDDHQLRKAILRNNFPK